MESIVSPQTLLNDEDNNKEISDDLIKYFLTTRNQTEELCLPLETEDYCIQTFENVSPIKWHIAHTSWFFENFLLTPYLKNYTPFHPTFSHLFNSYYELAGTFHPRSERGLLSRPTVKEIFEYRKYVNEAMLKLLKSPHQQNIKDILLRTTLGIHHEQQHQELMLTDIKHIFNYNPLKPVYLKSNLPQSKQHIPAQWLEYDEGIYEIGANYSEEFIFDNESPKHKVYLSSFAIASQLVKNSDFIAFIDDGGYNKPQYWLSDGWKTVQTNLWQAPLYWYKENNTWFHFTLGGNKPVDLDSPVCHVSYFEADAFARWKNCRLPSEAEWEHAAKKTPIEGNLRESKFYHPISSSNNSLNQFYGDVWEWTQSTYSPYPKYKASRGALGEYNGKFMCSQFVLKGGSCVTPKNHIRGTYRNFFYPTDQWQFSGIRLAKDI